MCLFFGAAMRATHNLSKYCFWQAERDAQRQQDAELVKMQEASAIRKEEARRATEQKILQEMIQTEKEKAKQEQQTDRIKALAEAEARALEQRELEEVTRRTMLEKMKGEKEKWLAAINTTFSHVEGFNSLSISNIYEVNLPFLFIPLGNQKR